MANPELGNESIQTVDPMCSVLYEKGHKAYEGTAHTGYAGDIHFDERNRFWIELDYVNSADQVPLKIMQQLKDVKARLIIPSYVDYSPEDRINAYIRGYGVAAAEKGDMETATAALDVLLDKDSTIRQDLSRSLIEFFELA